MGKSGVFGKRKKVVSNSIIILIILIFHIFSLVPSQSDHHLYNKYFFHLGHNFLSNCTVKNDKKWRESHFEKHENDLFDTYMYDGMAHREWATLEL